MKLLLQKRSQNNKSMGMEQAKKIGTIFVEEPLNKGYNTM
jgi:hypothetical protein